MFGSRPEDLSRQDLEKVRTVLEPKTEEAGISCLFCFRFQSLKIFQGFLYLYKSVIGLCLGTSSFITHQVVM